MSALPLQNLAPHDGNTAVGVNGNAALIAGNLIELNDNIAARTDSIYPEALAEVKPIIDASESYYKNYDGAMSAAPEWWANVFYPADDALFFGNITPEAFIEQIKSETIKFYANK